MKKQIITVALRRGSTKRKNHAPVLAAIQRAPTSLFDLLLLLSIQYSTLLAV